MNKPRFLSRLFECDWNFSAPFHTIRVGRKVKEKNRVMIHIVMRNARILFILSCHSHLVLFYHESVYRKIGTLTLILLFDKG